MPSISHQVGGWETAGDVGLGTGSLQPAGGKRIGLTGTVINVATVLVGGMVGAVVGERLPEKFRQTVMNAIGLMTLLIGFQMGLGTRSVIILLGSVVLGGGCSGRPPGSTMV
jgi:hypothetical protein